MRYEFKNAQGRVCCAGDGTTPPRLCPACQASAAAQTPMPSAPQWRRALDSAPPPPDMVAAIQAHRGVKQYKPVERPDINGAPAPPDMVAAIQAHRGRVHRARRERPLINGVPAPPDMVADIQAHRGGR